MSKNEERKRNRGQTDIKRRENVKWTEKNTRLFKEKKRSMKIQNQHRQAWDNENKKCERKFKNC